MAVKRIRFTIFVLLLTLSTSGLFALKLSLGFSGALYMDREEIDSSSGEDIWSHFAEGEGVYYGVNAELLFKKLALGLYTYFSFYNWDYYDVLSSDDYSYDMIDVDVNLSLSYHIFGTTAFLDPFFEGGFGTMTASIDSYERDGSSYDLNEPFTFLAREYCFLGLGLGVNFGGIGFYTKFQYHGSIGPVEFDSDKYGSFTTSDFPFKEAKVIIGGKIIL
ncbi:hypothetical protein [Sediminispirochaeta bajacaliforniensis]|uniref:hypothetical protein n=1 Tax=Sediminispirochaeta bajacaliforniensis TaxID=148 RepID=UPI00037FCE47|nr:hypothetical protein [Sediminispirochaeta bajacaliforniensis]